ncbi:MAG: DUF1800 domain-containing protein [Gemmatimonadetes bacterium]|nr:DUF1800 domain-containing protein [Gemmatimonadota bacterium]
MPLPPVRHAFRAVLLAGMMACAGGPPSPTFVEPARSVGQRELSVDQQARHALNRLAFGPRPGDVARVTAMGVDRWIAQQLTPTRLDDSAMDRVLAPYATLDATAGELLRDYPPPAALLARQRLRDGNTTMNGADSLALRQSARKSRQFVAELLSARVARAVASERQLQEVMTDFWLNHFSVFVGQHQLRYTLPEYERTTIRPHTLGRFRDLLDAVAKSPAMLTYLDNAQSVADSGRPTLASRGNAGRGDARRRRQVQTAVDRRRATMGGVLRESVAAGQGRRPRGLNENYARELLELHTLGVDGGYTQQDIIEVARALTGWTVRPPRTGEPTFWFNGAAHDAGEKRILGTRLAAGRGIEDGEQVLDLVARHPSTARFIARKLAVRFVSDSPPGALVERAADTFRRTDGDIREVVRTIVTSPEFFSHQAYRAKVKSPFEVVVSAARAVGGQADTSALSSLAVARLGQPLYGHQAPNGWPETGEAWMNTGAILSRINFGLTVASSRLPGARLSDWPPYATLRAAPREAQVAGVIEAFLGGEASRETREILMSGENPLLAGGAAPAGGEGGDARPVTPRRLAGLDQIVGLALGSPEFQRR